MPESPRPPSAAAALHRLRQPKTSADVTHALAALPDPASEEARMAHLAAYRFLDAEPTRRDRGAQTRVAILKRLRRAGMEVPTEVLLAATDRYEELQPDHEVASPLRATALVLLNDQDDALAAFAAIRLLFDPRRERMSGEPAVTAAHILAAQGNLAALYAYLCHPESGQDDIMQTAIVALRDAPAPIVAEAVAIGLADPRESVVSAAVETMLSFPDERYRADLDQFMRADGRPSLVEFLALTIAANRIPWQIDLLQAARATATPPWRRETLDRAFNLLIGPG